MNKFYFAATAAIALVTAAAGSTAEANGFLLGRYFKNRKRSRISQVNADAGIDAALAEEKAWNPEQPQSGIYNLVAHHPCVVVAGLLTRRDR